MEELPVLLCPNRSLAILKHARSTASSRPGVRGAAALRLVAVAIRTELDMSLLLRLTAAPHALCFMKYKSAIRNLVQSTALCRPGALTEPARRPAAEAHKLALELSPLNLPMVEPPALRSLNRSLAILNHAQSTASSPLGLRMEPARHRVMEASRSALAASLHKRNTAARNARISSNSKPAIRLNAQSTAKSLLGVPGLHAAHCAMVVCKLVRARLSLLPCTVELPALRLSRNRRATLKLARSHFARRLPALLCVLSASTSTQRSTATDARRLAAL